MNIQKGVLIKDVSGHVLEKRVYGGDLSNVEDNLKKEGVICTIYSDTNPIFSGAELGKVSNA